MKATGSIYRFDSRGKTTEQQRRQTSLPFRRGALASEATFLTDMSQLDNEDDSDLISTLLEEGEAQAMGALDPEQGEGAEGQETNRDRRGRGIEDEETETEDHRPAYLFVPERVRFCSSVQAPVKIRKPSKTPPHSPNTPRGTLQCAHWVAGSTSCLYSGGKALTNGCKDGQYFRVCSRCGTARDSQAGA